MSRNLRAGDCVAWSLYVVNDTDVAGQHIRQILQQPQGRYQVESIFAPFLNIEFAVGQAFGDRRRKLTGVAANKSRAEVDCYTLRIDSIYGLTAGPVETFVKLWPKAIPQYEINYPHLRQSIVEQCAKTPGLYLCANYLDGISFNDCVNNAKSLAKSLACYLSNL